MIGREKLAEFGGSEKSKPDATPFDLEAYVTRHEFNVISRKPWTSHPGGLIFELDPCPLNSDHKGGSAAFTYVDGVPGFTCKHNGCCGKTIKDVFATYTPAAATNHKEQTEAQSLIELCKDVELFHTPQGEGYARLSVDRHRENWALGSSSFSRWLVRKFHLAFGKPALRRNVNR